MTALPLRRHAAVTPPSAGDRLIRVSVGTENELQALWCAGEDWDALFQNEGGRYRLIPHGRPLRPVDLRLSVHQPGRTLVRTMPAFPLAFPHVHLLPGNRVLAVGNKCVWRPSGPERNAVIYDADGRIEAEETWGDDITGLAVAADDTIWVGYGSIAIWSSSNGWGDPGPIPPGYPGLIRYSSVDLRRIWSYPRDNPWGRLDSCDAMNVAGDGTWISYSGDFPVVRIREHDTTGWHNNHAMGARALAVGYRHIALVGGYEDTFDRLTLGTLHDGRFELAGHFRIVMPDGAPISRTTMIGRGPTLHTVIDDAWYQISLDDISS